MTVLRFYNTGRKRMVAYGMDARPMIQREGGCDAMWDLARQVGGLWVSDVPVKGWSDDCRWSGGYIYVNITGYGNIGLGYINGPQAGVVGMDQKSKDPHWYSDNQCHRMTAKQWREYRAVGNDVAEQKKIVEGMFPPAPQPPAKVQVRKGIVASMNLLEA